MFSTFWPPQPSSPGQSRSRWKPLLVARSRPLALGRCSSPGATSERFTSAALALQAIVNCKRPVCSPHPSSMTPLQLSSIALKQSSGPVGVHAGTSDPPSGPATFETATSVTGARAPGAHAAHDRHASREKQQEGRKIGRFLGIAPHASRRLDDRLGAILESSDLSIFLCLPLAGLVAAGAGGLAA